MVSGLLADKIMSIKCLVLGGNGFIGSHLVDSLLKFDCNVRVFDRPGSILACGKNTKDVEQLEGDIRNDSELVKAMDGCDICFHLVSSVVPKSSNEDPLFDIETNLLGSVRLLNHAIERLTRQIQYVPMALLSWLLKNISNYIISFMGLIMWCCV